MVMSMKHDEMPLSPLATMLQDSNGSSSGGEDQLLNNEVQQMPQRSPLTINTPTLDRNLILSPKQFLQQQQRELLLNERQLLETMRAYGLETPQTPSLHHSQLLETMRAYGLETPHTHSLHHSQLPESSTDVSPTEEHRLSQIMSPVVIKDSVSTGGEYR